MAEHPEATGFEKTSSGIEMVLTCAGRVARFPIADLSDGQKIPCPCETGVSLKLSGIEKTRAEVEALEKEVEKTNRSLDQLGIARIDLKIS